MLDQHFRQRMRLDLVVREYQQGKLMEMGFVGHNYQGNQLLFQQLPNCKFEVEEIRVY